MSTIKKMEEKKRESTDFEIWLANLYNVSSYPDEKLFGYYDIFKYRGFDRNETLKALKAKVNDQDLVIQIIIVCALNGPVRASKAKLTNSLTVSENGIPASGQKGTNNISCARITSATADLAAYFLKKFNVPKRMLSNPLPGWLQFPAAGSIKLPLDMRADHIEFSKRFSLQIGGSFNEQIYAQMESNAYLNINLRLFE